MKIGDSVNGNGKLRLPVGWVTLFLMGTDLFVVSPLLPAISEAYRASSAATGWMVTVFALTYAVSAPVFGWLSDRRDRRSFIVFGLALFAISNALTAFAPSFAWLIASRMAAGVSVASITPLIYAIVGETAPPERRGTWLSVVVSGHLTALWAGAPLGTWIEFFLGWRAVFLFMAAAGVFLAIVNFHTWGPNLQRKSSIAPSGNLSNLLRSVSVTALWAVSMYALYVYLGAALLFENGFSASEIALAVTFYGVGAVIGSLASGRLADTFGEKNISNVSLLFLVFTLFGLGILFSSGDWIYFLLFLWAMVGYAGFTSYQARLAVEYPNERGMAMAWNNTALYIGITIGSMVGGFAISTWGYVSLPYVCGMAAILSLIFSGFSVRVRKNRHE